VALDCETTGLSVRTDEIISIAAVRILGNRVMTSERIELLVRPERRRVSAESVRVHHLRGSFSSFASLGTRRRAFFSPMARWREWLVALATD
jgi:hypothetical protein